MNLTQKISQMTPKGADLDATDLIEVSTIVGGSYVTKSITGQELIDAIPVPPSGITIGSTAIASGVVGRVLFEGTGNVVQESSSLAYDDTLKTFTLIGPIGSVIQHTALTNYNGFGGFQLNVADGTERAFVKLQPNSGEVRIGATGSGYFPTFYAQGVEAMRIFASTRNIGINTTTDAGFKLDVNGTARVKTDLKIETATGGLIIEGDASGYPTLKINTLRSGTTRRNWMFATEQINGGDFILFRSATAGGVANTLVYSIFNDGNFGLNTSTNAGFRLDVNGTARVQGVLTIGTELYLGNNNTGFFKSTNDFNFYNLANGSVKYRITGASQGFGISDNGYDTVAASAMLQVNSTTKGFLPPRMTTTQKNAIATPAAGLMVYDTTLNVISYYNGTMWI